MKILDRYLIKNFLITYLFVAFVIVLIICMIDYTEKVDDFLEKDAPLNAIIFDYYLNLIPYWINYISPLMVFIATVFFTSRIAARTEIVAMLSSGISFMRILLPYMVGAVVLGALTFVQVGWILPMANKVRNGFEKTYVKSEFYFSGRNVHITIAPDVYAYLESYNNSTKTGNKFTMETVEGTKLKQKLSADKIVWQEDKGKWLLSNIQVRTLDSLKESISYPADQDTTINLSPKDFESDYNLFETFTLPELNNYIDLLKSRGADGLEVYMIEKYTRFTQPFAILILTAIGVIVSARKSRRGVGWQIALGFMLAFIYILFFLLSKGVAEAGTINTLLAVWLPNIVFSFIGMLLYKTLPR
ncbi:lipopolysaccharide export system permease protein [Dyadobacter jejuensis]|uniref:Lipopolysaccharide export system permease protein n=1 Tax=Dyadobacter jejuensis TaxID=1082580 RepID=A0A316AHP0_9BACT|nr:LptF/LptG family permease [Dyadobacter jejuensis]PWJ57192.1 lipopolysaccharide export system permease protein [Dyadobacter jejuensis]